MSEVPLYLLEDGAERGHVRARLGQPRRLTFYSFTPTRPPTHTHTHTNTLTHTHSHALYLSDTDTRTHTLSLAPSLSLSGMVYLVEECAERSRVSARL